MATDYSMYKCYKGEESSPFPPDSDQNFFWGYERIFEDNFWTMETYELYDFLSGYGLGDKYIKLLKGEDSTVKPPKAKVFNLWLEYFFKYKYQSTTGKALYQKL